MTFWPGSVGLNWNCLFYVFLKWLISFRIHFLIVQTIHNLKIFSLLSHKTTEVQKNILTIETGTILLEFPFNYASACSNAYFILCDAFNKKDTKTGDHHNFNGCNVTSKSKYQYIWNLRFWLEFRCFLFFFYKKINKQKHCHQHPVASMISIKEPSSLFCSTVGSTSPTFISFLMRTPITLFACFSLISIILLSTQ